MPCAGEEWIGSVVTVAAHGFSFHGDRAYLLTPIVRRIVERSEPPAILGPQGKPKAACTGSIYKLFRGPSECRCCYFAGPCFWSGCAHSRLVLRRRRDPPPIPTKSSPPETSPILRAWHLAVVQERMIVHGRGYGQASLEYGIPIKPNIGSPRNRPPSSSRLTPATCWHKEESCRWTTR